MGSPAGASSPAPPLMMQSVMGVFLTGHPGNRGLRHDIRRHTGPGNPFMALLLRGRGRFPLPAQGVRRLFLTAA